MGCGASALPEAMMPSFPDYWGEAEDFCMDLDVDANPGAVRASVDSACASTSDAGSSYGFEPRRHL